MWIIGEDLVFGQLESEKTLVSAFNKRVVITLNLLRSGSSYKDNQFGVFRDAGDRLEAEASDTGTGNEDCDNRTAVS